MENVYIVAAKRTPTGGFLGSLSHWNATDLGAYAIRSVHEQLIQDPGDVDMVIMGNVLSAGLGQSPARQAANKAGLNFETDATTINKVCSSGMKAIDFAFNHIRAGDASVVVAGGMESMSNTPHYTYMRKALKSGDSALTDGMLLDGLWDAHHNYHMGNAAEMGIRHFGFTREQLDRYALDSYNKAIAATNRGFFKDEVIVLSHLTKMGRIEISRDEDIDKLVPEKLPHLKPAFEENGLLTAANSSNLNDGASALLIVSESYLKAHQLKPLARIVACADAAQAPEWFTTSPAKAIPKALKKAHLELSDIDLFEINEAYASVAMSVQLILGIDSDKINVNGGAVAIGHPIGASGARIAVTLIHNLIRNGKKYGIAAICNGGGGASAIVIENTNI